MKTRFPALLCVFVLSCTVSGCGSLSSFVAGGMADLIPSWAGGLPAGAPPRPGSPEYEAYARQREQQNQPAALSEQDSSISTSADAVR